MNRPMNRKSVSLAAAVALVVVTGWFVLRPTATERPGGGAALGDLMRDFGVVPVTGAARPFTLPSLDGGKVALADFKGRPVIVYFWASW
jgi:cytochrome c biogenesis protein CcmG, thiol:disulfide interchange protein DsbE